MSGVELFADKRRNYMCAYRLWELRLFADWDESSWNGGTGDQAKALLEDDDLVYVQDNYMVTRGVYYNKNVVLPVEKVTPAFKEFVDKELKFVVPEWTQKEREVVVLSKEEKEKLKQNQTKALEQKISSSPNLLVAYNVVGDIIDEFTNEIPFKIYFRRKAIINGSEIKLSDSDGPLEVAFPGVLPSDYYTIICVDPDAPKGYAPTERSRRHWILGNIQGDNVKDGQIISTWEKPFLDKGQGWHRYVFLLFRQKGKIEYPTLDTISGNQERNKFNIREFAKQYNLGVPVGGFLFRIHAAPFTTVN